MIVEALLLALAQPAADPAAPSPPEPQPPTASTFEKLPTPEEERPLGSRVTRRTERVTASERDAAWTMHRFAECLVRTRQQQMLELLSTDLNSPEQNEIVREVIGWKSRCLQARSMRVDHILLRGAVAEALYRQELRGRTVGAIPNAPDPVDADPARSSTAALERFGRCMMARHPERVRALIGTRPGSREEREAMAGIEAALGECLPRAPAHARHPLRLRGAVAEAFYLDRHGLLGREEAGAAAPPPAAAPERSGEAGSTDERR